MYFKISATVLPPFTFLTLKSLYGWQSLGCALSVPSGPGTYLLLPGN